MYNDVLFNGTDLTEITGIKINNIVHENMPQTVMSSGKIAKNDGIKIFNKEYGDKVIYIEGYITRSSREDFFSTRDTLLKTIEPREKVLRIPLFNRPLEYTGTVRNTAFSDTGGGYGKFSIEFLCSDPFGYDMDNRTIINGTTITASNSDQSFSETIGGNYKTPAYVVLTVSSVVGGTGKYIDLSNQSGDSIRITRNWASNDQLIVDNKNRTCRVNGADVDFTGSFFDLSVDDTIMSYEDNFTTSRSVNLIVTYKRRNL